MYERNPYLSLPGLDTDQVEEARRTYGTNAITPKPPKRFLKQYLESFGDPIIKILLGALALNLIFLFKDSNWYESAGIAAAVFLATFVSTLSEYGSEAAFTKLMEEADCIQCRVLRNGDVVLIPVNEIVCGDVVLLQAGEKIPADGIIITGDLKVDQSALNGESKEVKKTVCPKGQEPSNPKDWDLLSPHQIFRGSVVDGGECVMKVLNVGDLTFYGHMAKEMQDETRESPLRIKLTGLARTLSRIGYAAAGLVACSDLFQSIILDNNMYMPLILAELPNVQAMTQHILHALTLAITIVVVAVPEGLPMMITVVLSSNMLRMLKDNVMVRKLSGIETAGSLNILFTDKTGTLTRGKLMVSHFISGNGSVFYKEEDLRNASALWNLVTLSGYHNTGSLLSEEKVLGGNATDRALLEYILPVQPQAADYNKLHMIPFDSARKFSAATVERDHSLPGSYGFANLPDHLTLIKGAPEKLLFACSRYFDKSGSIVPLTDKAPIMEKWHALTNNAVRVLLLAASDKPVTEDMTSEDFDSLILIGLAGIRDELRPEAPAAVREVEEAGIQVVMITGDNKDTARAIAKGSGLLPNTGALSSSGDSIGRSGNDSSCDGDLEGDCQVITSDDLAQWSDEELKKRLPHLRVVARALPVDKTRLVRAAQEMNMVAGMTGDGINDAPALKKADVGFAMGDGTEVAKEAGDIVILDNNIASISKAILYGRTIFKSIRKFIVFQLTMNFCAVGVSLLAPLMGMETPITVIQMLWVNIIMDTLAGLAFAGEAPLKEYMTEAPKRRDEPVLSRDMIHQIIFMGSFTVAMCLVFMESPQIRWYFGYDHSTLPFLTAFFTLFIFAGILNSFNARTERLDITAHLTKNPAFLGIMLLVAGIQLFLIYHGGSLFRTTPLTWEQLYLTFCMAALVIPADIVRKIVLRIRGKKGTY